MACTDSGGFCKDQYVTFVGLVSRADLNGKSGRLARFDSNTGRWLVTLPAEDVNVKPVNLQSAPTPASAPIKLAGTKAKAKAKPKVTLKVPAVLPKVRPKARPEASSGEELKAGKRVVFVGLSGRADLNGAQGTLGKFDPSAARWMVKVAKTGEEVNVRPANLQLSGISRPAVVAKPKKRGFKANLKRKLQPSGSDAKPAQLRKGKPPPKPKRALNAYQIFSRKLRPEIMQDHRARYGSVDMGMMQSEIAERWGELEDKDKRKYQRQAEKRRETVRGKMEVYQECVDPLGALRKKFAHLIPKRPTSGYFLFSSDEEQRKKATAEIKSSGSETSVPQKLAEMWKALQADEKAKYEMQYAKEKAEFDNKWKIWKKTKEYAQLEALEQKQKEAERATKQAKKAKEDTEMQELVKEGALPGLGLAEGRSASIVGLTSRDDLNGKEVKLVEFIEEVERWKVKLADANEIICMNVRPANLLLLRLVQEVDKAKKKEADDAEKNKVQELLKEGAAPGRGLAIGRLAVVTALTSQEDLNGTEVKLEEFNEDSGMWRVTQVSTAEAMEFFPENLFLSQLHAAVAKQAVKKQRKEATKNEIQELLNEGAAPGRGLAPGRLAVVTALTSREDLNGTEVKLEEFNAESGRWRVIQVATGEPMNLRPDNLFLSLLHAAHAKQEQMEKRKEIEREAKAAKEAAKLAMKEAAKEAARALRDVAKGMTETAKVASKQGENTTWSEDIEWLE